MAGWKRDHPGEFNASRFIEHFLELPCAVRHYVGGGAVPLTQSAMRKILRELGFRGRRGRPRQR
jgi:hypothetical protein